LIVELTEHQAKMFCSTHRSAERWVICVHATPETAKARLITHEFAVGEVLCPECSAEADADKPLTESLRIACGGGVRARFEVVGGN
jgi:hypothetical protein